MVVTCRVVWWWLCASLAQVLHGGEGRGEGRWGDLAVSEWPPSLGSPCRGLAAILPKLCLGDPCVVGVGLKATAISAWRESSPP